MLALGGVVVEDRRLLTLLWMSRKCSLASLALLPMDSLIEETDPRDIEDILVTGALERGVGGGGGDAGDDTHLLMTDCRSPPAPSLLNMDTEDNCLKKLRGAGAGGAASSSTSALSSHSSRLLLGRPEAVLEASSSAVSS